MNEDYISENRHGGMGILSFINRFISHTHITCFALKLCVDCCDWWNKHDKRIATLEFDRDRKSMGVIVNSSVGKKSLLVKVLSSLPLLSPLLFECIMDVTVNK